jgi:hypothetical protein
MDWVAVVVRRQMVLINIAVEVVSSLFVVTVLHNLVNNILSEVQYMLN